MNTKQTYSILFFLITLISCEKQNDDLYHTVNVAIPIIMNQEELRSEVKIQSPETISQTGKIYSYKNYLFINDKTKGIHIIDNSNPKNPIKFKLIALPANTDIAIKNDFLYADSGTDLVTFDISDMNSITEIGRSKEVFPLRYPPVPENTSYVDYSHFDHNSTGIITGYTIETRREKKITDDFDIVTSFQNTSNSVGIGGSLARFNIVDNYLYIVDIYNLSVFDIKNLNSPKALHQQYVGWEIETIFNQGNYMYIGSTTGMLIYDITNRAVPQHQSTISHLLACDPVVVQGDLAYVTLRGGNECGQPDSMLEVIDVQDKKNPKLLQTYPMQNPYGLGIKDQSLFVCDGTAGLRVFDISQTPTLHQTSVFQNINTKDVIPLEDKLLMISDDSIYQYLYEQKTLKLLSRFRLN